MSDLTLCPSCQSPTPPAVLAEAHDYAFWHKADGACPACVQQALLQTLLQGGDEALHEQIQAEWPLDAAAAFGALPTPLRLHADPRFTGQGITLAVLDSGFYPHADLTRPYNRIRAWVNATTKPVTVVRFQPNEVPQWPGWDAAAANQWHGTMTAVTAAGNGYLSHGLYSGLANEANLVLIQVHNDRGIHNPAIVRALHWVAEHQAEFGIRVVNMSFGGDPVSELRGNPVDTAVADLVAGNIVVTVAAGNDGQRRLVPPATAPEALTIGGLDDHNTFDHEAVSLWHSNYGLGDDAGFKPELVAPSIWVAAPVLPRTAVAREATALFQQRGSPVIEKRIAALKLITPHYQHVDGTSFAAPLVASTVTCMLEANPVLTPPLIRQILQQTATPIPGVPRERQGAGALTAGTAVALALREQHETLVDSLNLPYIDDKTITFRLVDHHATQVRLFGTWDGWKEHILSEIEAGVWQVKWPLLPNGRYAYKFLIDQTNWLDDPANPRKVANNFGGFNSLLIINS